MVGLLAMGLWDVAVHWMGSGFHTIQLSCGKDIHMRRYRVKQKVDKEGGEK